VGLWQLCRLLFSKRSTNLPGKNGRQNRENLVDFQNTKTVVARIEKEPVVGYPAMPDL